MCNDTSGPGDKTTASRCSSFDRIDIESMPDLKVGSLRKKLWDLPQKLFCPLVGVCIPLTSLRHLVKKIYLGSEKADDYALHAGVISECGHRNPLTLALQKELEQRYNLTIKQFKLAKSKLAVAQLWLQAIERGDIAGAFWAAATHPHCDAELHDVLYKDMHMLQHQAGACVRADLNKFNAVMNENATLTRELGRVQERITRQMTEKAMEFDKLKTVQVQTAAQVISKDCEIDALKAELFAIKEALPDRESCVRLQKRIEQLQLRETDHLSHIRELKQKLVISSATSAAAANLTVTTSVPDKAKPNRVIPIVVQLQQKSVLCVGGRSGKVASYRNIIERVGGRFAHHDGGLEDSQHLLETSLAAADLVICQTGCISHNAYWRVKDFCKRTGKQCVFVENPSASSLERGLEQFAATELQLLSVAAVNGQ
jgi:Uncharacterized protein conserved in bacteria (DUF2325)